MLRRFVRINHLSSESGVGNLASGNVEGIFECIFPLRQECTRNFPSVWPLVSHRPSQCISVLVTNSILFSLGDDLPLSQTRRSERPRCTQSASPFFSLRASLRATHNTPHRTSHSHDHSTRNSASSNSPHHSLVPNPPRFSPTHSTSSLYHPSPTYPVVDDLSVAVSGGGLFQERVRCDVVTRAECEREGGVVRSSDGVLRSRPRGCQGRER